MGKQKWIYYQSLIGLSGEAERRVTALFEKACDVLLVIHTYCLLDYRKYPHLELLEALYLEQFSGEQMLMFDLVQSKDLLEPIETWHLS
jgi:hypothetical protein